MTVTVANRQRAHRVHVARLKRMAGNTGAAFANLSIVLVNDATMARLNLRYHDTPGTTDILTFDYGDGQAEIIVSVDHAYARPRPARELALYVVHGILHLHGYDDRTPAQCRRMRAAERRLLSLAGR